MGLNKRRIGDLIALNNKKNTDDFDLPFYGINKDKEFMPTVASTDGLDRKKYKIMSKGMFVFSGMQTGRDMCIRIGLYDLDFDALISPAYTTFDVVSEDVLPEYLFMIFKSTEMDRYGAFLSDGSIRSNLDWDVFCDILIDLPDIPVQQRFVEIYQGMQENLDAMTRGVERMQETCDVYMEHLLKSVPKKAIASFIEQVDERNEDLQFTLDDVRGITTQKEFIPTKANMNGVSLHNYKIVRPTVFAYVADTSRRGDKISLSFNDTSDSYIVSSITTTFEIKGEAKNDLLPDYLFMFLRRPEFDRYARYNSWGSARETITWEDLGRLEIPIPPVHVQQSVVNIFRSCAGRKQLADHLYEMQKNICPILVRGSIEEGGQ